MQKLTDLSVQGYLRVKLIITHNLCDLDRGIWVYGYRGNYDLSRVMVTL